MSAPASAPRLTDEQVDRYRSDGVVVIRDAVDPETIERMIDAVEALMDAPTRFGGNMTRPGDPGMFFQDRHLFPRNETFRGFLDHNPLAGMAAQAMNSAQIRVYYEHVFVKDPGTEDNFVWHQDRPYWAVDGTQICSSWLALTASDASSSALEFVRGSHRWDRTFRPEFPSLEGRSPEEVENALWRGVAEHIRSFDDVCPPFEEHPELYDVISFAVEPGDALLFDFRTVHRSGPNAGSNRRVAISWRWLGDDAFWSPTVGSDPIVGPDDTVLDRGDPITDDAVFPLVYAAV